MAESNRLLTKLGRKRQIVSLEHGLNRCPRPRGYGQRIFVSSSIRPARRSEPRVPRQPQKTRTIMFAGVDRTCAGTPGIRLSALLLLVVLIAGCSEDGEETTTNAAASQASLDAVSWMAGYWVGESNGTHMEEVWLPPAGGVMLGLHRDVFSSGRSFFEFLRIEATNEGLILLASPRGREPTSFWMVEIADQRVWFENPEHDYPQRIGYWMAGDSLYAGISGTDSNGLERSSTWAWTKGTLAVK